MDNIKQLLTFVLVLGSTMTLVAQEKTYADRWAVQETKRYTENLGLSEEQAKQVHEILLTTAKKAEEIKEKETGEAQKKAIWRNTADRNKQLQTVLTAEQQQKLKKMQGGGAKANTNAVAADKKQGASAVDDAFIERWVNERVAYYTTNLGLSGKQAQAFHEVLLSTSKKAAEIKEKETGDTQKKALWQNTKDRKDSLLKVLNDDQKKKFEELK
ncbi:hypothetical protein G5B00_04235 [Parapedobacter sp. SGR-10]|uniref:hypothetical protein n=1 Tax=Parapedobacter sp. SGR-10 TaxID=2710879 RepID=UPI0013D1AB82|nr:hypothetical protein [Parapedobacter sp. SGR-10]NGF55713.1 hypothetical protein [Parapedobacter sp. SGR-10]